MTTIEVRIRLKKGVTDPEGSNTKKTLESLGFKGIDNVRTVKVFEIETKSPEPDALRECEEMCKSLLANPVIQNYELKVRK